MCVRERYGFNELLFLIFFIFYLLVENKLARGRKDQEVKNKDIFKCFGFTPDFCIFRINS